MRLKSSQEGDVAENRVPARERFQECLVMSSPWVQETSGEGKTYYHNTLSGETRWTPPPTGEKHTTGVVTGSSNGDLEFAAMNAKPSNIIVGIVFALAAISTGLVIAASASDTWAGKYGLAEKCQHSMTSGGEEEQAFWTLEGMPVPCYLNDSPTSQDVAKVKAPARYTICRRYGEVPDTKLTLRVPGQPEVICYKRAPTPAPASPGTPFPGQPTPSTTSITGPSKYNYAELMMKDEDGAPKGEIIVNLGFLLTIAIVSVVLHAILTVAAGAVVVVGSIHNCCPTGKCPPVLPVICVGIAGVAAILCIVAQCALLFIWLVGAGSFFSAQGSTYGLAFDISVYALAIDCGIVAILAWRQEMRIRTCCAGREHFCAKC